MITYSYDLALNGRFYTYFSSANLFDTVISAREDIAKEWAEIKDIEAVDYLAFRIFVFETDTTLQEGLFYK